jgi:hypothetical protein
MTLPNPLMIVDEEHLRFDYGVRRSRKRILAALRRQLMAIVVDGGVARMSATEHIACLDLPPPALQQHDDVS